MSQLKMETQPLAVDKAQLETKWNTKNLFFRLAADVVSAGAAASMVAPLISIIDRYVLPVLPNQPR